MTEIKLDSGLRGVAVGTCPTSALDPVRGLSYAGYPIDFLAWKEPLEVAYLLFHRELPDPDELKVYTKDIQNRSANFPAGFDDYLKALPKEGHPMKWFSSSLLWLGMTGGTNDYREDSMNLVSWLPEMTAKIIAIREGRPPLQYDPKKDYITNFVHILNQPGASTNLSGLMKAFFILHLDHAGGNLSTFTGKCIASGLEDLYGSMSGAMCALAGPRHGMANQKCFAFLKELYERLNGEVDNRDKIKEELAKIWDEGGLIYGFGHAVLRVEDKRAQLLLKYGELLCSDDPYFRLAQNLRHAGSEFLMGKEKVKDPFVNVDIATGPLLNACGLTEPNYYTLLFGMSRSVGIAAQIVYERCDARDGKGIPIMRPKFVYNGPTRSF